MTRISKELTINDVARIPFFNDLGDNDLKLLAGILELHYYDKNAFIFKEHDIQDSFFFITEGTVSVIKDTQDGGYEVLAELNAPQVIGEMAIITPGTRSASIKTLTDVTLVRFSCASFEKIIKVKPGLAINILRKAGNAVSTRLKKINQNYVNMIHSPKTKYN